MVSIFTYMLIYLIYWYLLVIIFTLIQTLSKKKYDLVLSVFSFPIDLEFFCLILISFIFDKNFAI